jgi:ABC-type sugar transport system permease subunit
MSIVLLVVMMLTLVVPMAFANDTIMDRVTAAKGTDSVTQLEERAATVGESFIKFLRNTAIIIAVIMFVIVAYALIFSPNVNTISDCKGRVGALVLAIAIAIMAEEIVGTLMGWFGG